MSPKHRKSPRSKLHLKSPYSGPKSPEQRTFMDISTERARIEPPRLGKGNDPGNAPPRLISSIRVQNFLTLEDVTLRLSSHYGNRIAVLVGPNGSGKSNFLRTLSNLDDATKLARESGKRAPRVTVKYEDGTKEELSSLPKTWGILQWKRFSPSNAVKISSMHDSRQICEEVLDSELHYAAEMLLELRDEHGAASQKEALLHEKFSKITGWQFEIVPVERDESSTTCSPVSPQSTTLYTFSFNSPSYHASTETIDTGSLMMFLCLFNLYCFDVVMLDDFDRAFHPNWTRLYLSCLRYEKNKSIILISHSIDSVTFSPSHSLTAVRKVNGKTKFTSFKDIAEANEQMVSVLTVGQVMSIFFAECALIVEGKNDAILLSEMQNLALVDPNVNAHEDFFKASIIPTGGSASVPTCVHLCSLLGVPCKVIFDLDELLKEDDNMVVEDDDDDQKTAGGHKRISNENDLLPPDPPVYNDMQWKDNSAGFKVLEYFGASIPHRDLPHNLRAAKLHNNIWRWETPEMYHTVVNLLGKFSSRGVFFWCKGAIEGFLYDVWPEWNVEHRIPLRLFKGAFWRQFSEETRTRFFELAMERGNKQFARVVGFLNTEFHVVEVREENGKKKGRNKGS